eukprot:573385-Prymnesium_polylepis.1
MRPGLHSCRSLTSARARARANALESARGHCGPRASETLTGRRGEPQGCARRRNPHGGRGCCHGRACAGRAGNL